MRKIIVCVRMECYFNDILAQNKEHYKTRCREPLPDATWVRKGFLTPH